ncbi:peptide-methionine (S)-S-oxide reductase MsrA [Pseudomonas chlororaphis]|uniref:peptide-methionine (S)-S-oxide reductase MsrA n=1 Tax=Pseudomonas chlororaphis TaxID=587753 RepID=UPI0006A5ACDB|nr:peptide-methionine (S)-S-oxide reductase MsrA [Pseudomonas chlororaphis]AZC30454.1 Peptide methionine sulfoxide reductase MsrA [Pseudomonas chlororaphis subsp. piscium]WDG78704.1 peptide-methionine (S)-S-oxide reductase MsrA [Pseudomonas chlororaphis]WDG88108.1 peptide-methionine (S)-S-oxide reductase MsrA [Pseudomonas chlororaphis]WDG94367.1 peptide-methionine (S)-S-oxide reductase MsrA [Pseudomonas chlororaphis]SDT17358.1 peptide-methionine (S)-S-oxide reductase [Pseudomonas chlororaphis]
MSGIKQATFGAGCFWGAEAAFRALPGVVETRVGYAVEAADEALQIEVVQVDFDPQVLAYTRLIEHFWGLHDPTSVDRQGEHGGGKYRSAIFYHDGGQAGEARVAKVALQDSGRLSKPVATVVVPLGRFELADEGHQRYLEKNGLSSCHI